MAGILIGIHALRMFVLPEPVDWQVIQQFAFVPAQVFGPAEAQGALATFATRVVPFVSYAFLHGDLLHLGFNTLWLVAMGSPVERILGARRFCAFAAVGTVFSALAYGLAHTDSPAPMIGASGAISAMMGAVVRVMFALGNKRGRALQPGLVLFVGIWIALNVFTGVFGIGPTGTAQAIAWEAHIGGFLTGLLLLPLFMSAPLSHEMGHRLRGANEDR